MLDGEEPGAALPNLKGTNLVIDKISLAVSRDAKSPPCRADGVIEWIFVISGLLLIRKPSKGRLRPG